MADSVTVHIPTPLRPHAGDNSRLELAGATVGDVLETLAAQHPELGRRLFKAEGKLNRYINIYVNDEDIRFQDNLGTALKAGDNIVLVPAIAGG
jgi:MoaD family protein